LKKVQIFIEHDIIIRHFLYSRTFSELEKNFEIQYVFPLQDQRVKTDIDTLGLKSVVKIPVDRNRLAKLRHLAKIQTMVMSRKNKSFRFVKKLWRTLTGWKNYSRMYLKSLPGVFSFYKQKILKETGIWHDMERIIDEFSPDVIIHPSVLEGLFISDLSLLTEKKMIPFIALMNSWDNPSTKAMIIKSPDWLVVWGEQTKCHAIDFLGMKPEQIKIFGAAQLEVYRQPPSKTREVICQSLNVDLGKKLILYAGSSKSINEMKHLKFLDESVAKGDLMNCHIIFRPHPWRTPAENEPDFYDVPWKNVSMDPSMTRFYNNPKQANSSKINLTDYMDTHNLLNAADLLISNMSTITIEAAIHGKPVLCMVSDKDIKASTHLRVTINSLYFKELLEKLEVPRCSNFKDLPGLCGQLLKQSSSQSFIASQKQKARFFVDQSDEPYPVQLNKFVREVISDRKQC